MVLCYGAVPNWRRRRQAMAMIGAFLGLERGIEALLWTFVFGSGVAIALLIWRVGVWRLIARTVKHLASSLRWGVWSPLSSDERRELQAPLFLAPSPSLAAVAMVLASHAWGWY